VAFEDSDLGLEAALSAGMHAVAVPDLKALPPELAARTRAVIPSLADAVALLQALRHGASTT
jgi:beta-phosphoglucomutase-like phosphatase (HAD superfamily)